MKTTLALRYGPEPLRPAAAWLIPGDDPTAWLAEIARWNVPQRGLRLLIVSRADAAETHGLLVSLPAGVSVTPSPRCRPYGIAGRRILIPVEATIHPPAVDEELAALLPSPDAAYVWHPIAGLLAFAAEETLRVSDLVAPLSRRDVAWDRALPGVTRTRRLVSIEPDMQPLLEQMMQEMRGDIGDDADHQENLPQHPDERGPVGKAMQGMLGGMAGAAKWIAEHVPKGAGGEALRKLQHWAEQTMHNISQSLELERNKELARLLKMLDDNPDEGLRYALPLAGDAAHRGVAPPGARLAPRDPNFNLGRLGGGGAVDSWDAGEYRAKLMQRYRELANRELALGRHRRAAYIFAELLGDVSSAAGALESGDHFREAAVLYEQRLKQPYEAARCLMKGCLWAEAIALYDKLGEHEKVGDLYTQLEDPEQAAAAYERAIDKSWQTGDYLTAAKLMENKLRDVDRAYASLIGVWPETPQAARCAAEAFHLLARHARHGEAARVVREWSQQAWPDVTAIAWIQQLSQLATDYPEQTVRELAADRTRSLAAKRLADERPGELTALTQAVGRLVPSDRLLARDSQRYLERRMQAQPRTPVRRVSALTLLRGYHLPSGVDWRSAIAPRKVFYAAGWQGSQLVVVRGNVDDVVQAIPESWNTDGGDDVLLTAHPGGLYKVIAHPLWRPPLSGDRWFPQHGASFDERMSVGSHNGISPNTIGVHYGDVGRVICIDTDDDLQSVIIKNYGQQGDPLGGTFSADLYALTKDVVETVPVTQLFGWTVLIAVEKWLIFASDPAKLAVRETPHPITSIACARPYSSPRVAVSMQQGGMLLFGDKLDAPREYFAHDMAAPVTYFTERGQLVAAAEQGIEVYDTREGRLKLIGKQDVLFAKPLAVVAGKTHDQFRVLFADGRVRVYQMPGVF